MSSKQPHIEMTPGNIKATMKEVGASSGDLWKVPFNQLHILPGFNVREAEDPGYREHIDHLKSLIRANGYDQDKPMSGYVAVVDGDSRVVVTNGHTRYTAISELIEEGLEFDTIPVVLSGKGSSTEDLTVSLATSNEGKRLTPYELGSVIKRLLGYGWDEARIAQRLNVTSKYISDLTYLHSLPSKIRDMVRKGKVSASVAIQASKQHGDKAGDLLGAAVKAAEGKGKGKASKKDLAPTWKTEVRKNGAKLYESLMWVKEDPFYAKLSEGTRRHIERLLLELPPEPEDVRAKSLGEEPSEG